MGPRLGGEHVGESVDLLDHAGAIKGLPVLAAEAGTFGVRPGCWLAGGRRGLDSDLDEPGGEEDVADDGGGDAAARLICSAVAC